jgi:hypothetical protein
LPDPLRLEYVLTSQGVLQWFFREGQTQVYGQRLVI